MIGKSALEISKFCPPGRNEKGEYFDIWWASLHMVYERIGHCNPEPNKSDLVSYNNWILKEYLPSKDTIWANPENQNELITVRQNGGLYFTYLETIKVGDTVNWEDVPDNSLVFDDFAFDYGDSKRWWVFYKAKGCFAFSGNYENEWRPLVVSDKKWNTKQAHSPQVKIIALNLNGTESVKEITEKFLNS
jgi:hypothetical protein